MSTFHALWSVGGFLGAGSVIVMATLLDLTGAAIVLPLMLLLAVRRLIALVVALRITPPTAVVAHQVDGVKTKIPRIAWLLAAMGARVRAVRGHGDRLVGAARHRGRRGRLHRRLGRPGRRERLHGGDPAVR